MNPLAVRDQFLRSTAEWVCDSYSLSIRYLAVKDQSGLRILDAALSAGPLPPPRPVNFSIEVGSLCAGQKTFPSLKRTVLEKKLEQAANGKIEVNGFQLTLDSKSPPDYYAPPPNQETWFSDLHLIVQGNQLPPSPIHDSIEVDQALRCITPPFDGMADLSTLLQLSDPRSGGRQPTINIRVNPPVDVMFDNTSLRENKFQALLHAHPKFDIKRIGLAIREFPGDGVKTRKQVAHDISWKRVSNGRRPGLLDISLINADSVLAMLTVGGRTVRRQWHLDPDKATNSRYVATQLFDKELKQLRDSVLNPIDPDRFERGIASLLFLLGFSPAVQVETQAPDIVVTTPGDKIAVIECTIKIADFHSKLGKLVDRRNALVKVLGATGHNLRVDSILVCGSPRAQIAADESLLIQHQVTLIAKEDLEQAFNRIRIPTNPDEMLDRAAAQLASRNPIDR
ncbi:hypothetical protein [Curvibacter fontanus]